MKNIFYILLFLPFTTIAQEVPTVNGYKTYLDNKQVDITHYFIDPDNIKNIYTDREAREVYITRKEQAVLVCLANLISEAKNENSTIIISVNGNVIKDPQSYYIENSTVTGININKTTETSSIKITTKNSRKI